MIRQNLVTKNTVELRQAESSFAAACKEKALDKFKVMPMPDGREEDWKYTEMEKLNLDAFSPFKSEPKIHVTGLSEDVAQKGVILTDINTAFEKYANARKHYFKGIKADNDKFVALSAACFNSGIFLYIPKNVEVEEPIMANFCCEGRSSIIHNIIIAGSNSKVNFIEEYSNREIGQEQLNACVTELFADNSSKVNFYHLNNWTSGVYNFTSIAGTMGKDASINWVSGCFGGKLNRLGIDTNFNGQGSQCNNVGIFIGEGKEHTDITTNAYHNIGNTTNNILVCGILKDEASSACRGLIKIEKKAQKSNSHLTNRILKLGEKTMASSIPSLKIEANDVKAGHGAAIGQIDEEQIFYLMARGLSREAAEKLIAEGFFEPAMQKIHEGEFRDKIRKLVRQ